MKNSKKKRNTLQKASFAEYERSRRWEKNKVKKLTRHVKSFPLDLQAAKDLKVYLKKGGEYKRRNRGTGLHLPKLLAEKIGKTGRFTTTVLKTLRMLTNPQAFRPAGSMNLDILRNMRKKKK